MLNAINSFAFVLSPIFYRLVYMSIIATCIGIAILIIRKIFAKKLAPKWISRLWLLVLIALICPIQFSSIFSIYNYIPDNTLVIFDHTIKEIPNISYRKEYDIAKQELKNISNENVSISQKEQIQKNNNRLYIKSLIADVILPYVWLIIGGILVTAYILTYIFFANKISKCKESKNERILFILDKCKDKLKINKKVKIIQQDKINTPSLFGFFNIYIILPNNINNLSDYEIKYVLMHELSHYKRKDNILKLCWTIIKDIYFFNPIIYIIYKQIIKDMETATDEMAVSEFDTENKKEYCRTLIKLTDNYAEKNFVSKTLAISDSKDNLKRRITMIKLSDGFIKHKVLISVISIIVILVLGILFLTTPKTEDIEGKQVHSGQTTLKILTQEEALNLGKERFERIKTYYWSWMNNNIESNGETSRIKVEHTRNVQNICTENGFKQFLAYWNLTLENDGYYYFGEGIGANPRYISDELSVKNISESRIEFIDTVKYDDDPAIKENKFILVRVGEDWLVEEFTSPY